MAGMLDRIRKGIADATGATTISNAMGDALKQAEAAQFSADEKKYGPRIAREEAKKRMERAKGK